MNTKKLVKNLKSKIKSYKKVWNKDARIIHLFEEVGEFAEIIMQYKGLKNPRKNEEDIKNALSDIVEDIFVIAILFDINIDDIFNEISKQQ